jgi:hypothetical protein
MKGNFHVRFGRKGKASCENRKVYIGEKPMNHLTRSVPRRYAKIYKGLVHRVTWVQTL